MSTDELHIEKEKMAENAEELVLYTIRAPTDQAWKFRHYFVNTLQVPEEQIVSTTLLPPGTFGVMLSKEQHAPIALK